MCLLAVVGKLSSGVVRCSLFVVCCVELMVVRCVLSAVCRALCAVCCVLFATYMFVACCFGVVDWYLSLFDVVVSGLLLGVCVLMFVVGLLFAVWCASCIVRCVLFVVCCVSLSVCGMMYGVWCVTVGCYAL